MKIDRIDPRLNLASLPGLCAVSHQIKCMRMRNTIRY